MKVNLSKSLKSAFQGRDVSDNVRHYYTWNRRAEDSKGDGASYDHSETVNDYYDLCNVFMTWGWNESLHFAPLCREETVEDSIRRHQRLMIEKLKLQSGMQVVDVGCGECGPMRRVAKEAEVSVFCINNNLQQLNRARERNVDAKVDHLAEYCHCNFMDMSSIEAGRFDAGYAIESTCHAPDKRSAFAEIYRLLKPGALFWGQEMCLTEVYDPENEDHQRIKQDLMRDIALYDIFTFPQVNEALESVGFNIIEAKNRGTKEISPVPWYQPMEGRYNFSVTALRRTPIGRMTVHSLVKFAEFCRIFPQGSSNVIKLMDQTARSYVAGGQTGIFTTLYCFLAQKPYQ